MKHPFPVRSAEDIGVLIARARRDRGQSQRDLAAEVGVSQAWLSRVERGHQKSWIGQVLRLAAHLGVHLHAGPTERTDTKESIPAAAPTPYPDLDDLV